MRWGRGGGEAAELLGGEIDGEQGADGGPGGDADAAQDLREREGGDDAPLEAGVTFVEIHLEDRKSVV